MNAAERKAAIAELRRLSRLGHGRITAEQLFRMASEDKKSPLRPIFCWNKNEAFYAHNINLARSFIRSVKVVISNETTEVRAVGYVRDPRAGQGLQGYVSVDRVKTDEDVKREVLINEFVRIAGLLKRARDLAAYFGMQDDVDGMVETLNLMQQQVGESAAIN